MNIEIVRTDRKTIGLAVQDPDTLVVRAPRGVGDAHIEAVLAARKEWIDAAARKMAQRAALIADIRAEAGGVMLLDGVRHAVVRRAPHGEQSEGSSRLMKDGPTPAMTVYTRTDAAVRGAVLSFLHQRAQSTLVPLACAMARDWSWPLGRVRIRGQKRRWGSCSSRGDLSLNRAAVCAPAFVQRHLLVHELCHLRHMDHSRAFQRLLTQRSPRAREAAGWLDEHAGLPARLQMR